MEPLCPLLPTGGVCPRVLAAKIKCLRPTSPFPMPTTAGEGGHVQRSQASRGRMNHGRFLPWQTSPGRTMLYRMDISYVHVGKAHRAAGRG
jgi:hypothetical protein